MIPDTLRHMIHGYHDTHMIRQAYAAIVASWLRQPDYAITVIVAALIPAEEMNMARLASRRYAAASCSAATTFF